MTMMATEKDAAPDNTTLQMVRAEINGREFQRWMGSRRLQDPDHAMHCLLKECFGDLAPRPFRLIMPRDRFTGTLYGYGQAGAEELREASDICAEPLQARIIPSVKVDSKVMPSEWTAGKRLGFETRLRPTVRKARGSGRHNDEQMSSNIEQIPTPRAKCLTAGSRFTPNGLPANSGDVAGRCWSWNKTRPG